MLFELSIRYWNDGSFFETAFCSFYKQINKIVFMMNKLLSWLLIAICWSCSRDTQTEKYQNERNNVVNVREKVKEIKIDEDDVVIGGSVRLYTLDNYLIISDHKPMDKLIHLFDKNRFTYITSIADRGQGPDEITNMGHIATNDTAHEFYVSDNGKLVIFSYNLDSVLANPAYKPQIKMKMNKGLFPIIYQYINDTLSMGQVMEPIGNYDFNERVAKFNMNTGKITPVKYVHSGLKKNLVCFAVSMEDSIYVECSHKYDIMSICYINGDLKYNIYGPNWNGQEDKLYHYQKVVFCNDKIVASYSGKDWNGEHSPTQFFVFTITGNYIRTLETGYQITNYCYDKANNRIIMNLNEADIQFAYLDLDGLIE
jgi:hypothetical protein